MEVKQEYGKEYIDPAPGGGIYLPRMISYFRLNADNTYSPCCEESRCNVYIRDTQLARLWADGVIGHIRETYGDVIGVMHFAKDYIGTPIYDTMKFVLGG